MHSRLLSAFFAFFILTLPLVGQTPAAPEPLPTGPAPAAPGASATDDANPVENSVVKIFATERLPDFFKPWSKQSPREITASGIVISGDRILTNAHAVNYAEQIEIQANKAGDRISATVESISPQIDLAVLKLDDPTFFKTHQALTLAPSLPRIKDSVLVYGYPMGGTSLSITKGIVSRIEYAQYGGFVSGLRVQIDAAINPGNSGGPALVDNQVIGLAFSRIATAQNIGYIIPCEEINLFLKQVAKGPYEGRPVLFDGFQTLESPALRAYVKADSTVQGLVVDEVSDFSPADPLKKYDIATAIGDTPIDDEGMVRLESGLRVRASYLILKYAKDGMLPLMPPCSNLSAS